MTLINAALSFNYVGKIEEGKFGIIKDYLL